MKGESITVGLLFFLSPKGPRSLRGGRDLRLDTKRMNTITARLHFVTNGQAGFLRAEPSLIFWKETKLIPRRDFKLRIPS